MRFSILTFTLAGAMCTAPLLAATSQQQASPQQTKTADRLLSEVKSDAQVIASHAATLERLSKDPHAQWAQFDEQWNQIKPAQEQLQARMWRLEAMRNSLPDQQQKALDQSKQAVAQISARTRQLLKMMDQPGVNLTSAAFRSDAQSLNKSAETLIRVS